MNQIGNIKNKNILLLQGPNGPFFKKLDNFLSEKGAATYRIGFNFGDYFYSNKHNYYPYKLKPKKWDQFIEKFLLENKIDIIFLFGDNRFYQRIAKKKALKHDIKVYVFEEGYIRPNYITMELYGVNEHSKIPKNREFYDNVKIHSEINPKPMHNKYSNMAVYSTTYYMLSNIFFYTYPNYKHHRDFSMINEAFFGIRNLLRKNLYKIQERKLKEEMGITYKKNYYFVPLQVHDDFQIRKHSHYKSIAQFIIEVAISFAKNAPDNTYLIFKHHPMDRGKKNYSKLLSTLSYELGLENRVISSFDIHLPTCLKNALGTITINSTVGLSSIYHNTPTKVLGKANYNIEGLTCKKLSLDQFWNHYYEPDYDLFLKFRYYLVKNTQVNGSFYGDFPDFSSKIY